MTSSKLLLPTTAALIGLAGVAFTATATADDGNPGTVCHDNKPCYGPLNLLIDRILGYLP